MRFLKVWDVELISRVLRSWRRAVEGLACINSVVEQKRRVEAPAPSLQSVGPLFSYKIHSLQATTFFFYNVVGGGGILALVIYPWYMFSLCFPIMSLIARIMCAQPRSEVTRNRRDWHTMALI